MHSYRRFLTWILLFTVWCLFLPGTTLEADDSGNPVVTKYLEASQTQQQYLRNAVMDVDIDAGIPKLKKQGKMHALRVVSRLGKITYDKIMATGDNTVKKEVIARYLNLETNPPQKGDAYAITPQNYKFKFRGVAQGPAGDVYVLQVSPRKKREGLFKGEIWLDKNTCMPVREAGKFVKSPLLVKNIEFVREYDIKDGVALPKRFEGHIDTRIVGRTDIAVEFSNFTRPEPSKEAEVTSTPEASTR